MRGFFAALRMTSVFVRLKRTDNGKDEMRRFFPFDKLRVRMTSV